MIYTHTLLNKFKTGSNYRLVKINAKVERAKLMKKKVARHDLHQLNTLASSFQVELRHRFNVLVDREYSQDLNQIRNTVSKEMLQATKLLAANCK